MIVVATTDFELYYGVVNELRDRGVQFTTIEPGEELPESTTVVLTDVENEATCSRTAGSIPTVVADPDKPRQAVERALASVRGSDGRTIIGVDPGYKPGIVVCRGGQVVAAFQVPLTDAVDVIVSELESAGVSTGSDEEAATTDAVVRIGDGSRLESAALINDLEGVRVELVDETGTTPYLGTGSRGMGDVLAAVNIARLEGEPVDSREIEPTAGELQVIKNRSREHSEENREITDALARKVATGDLSLTDALEEHRNGSETEQTSEDDH